MAAFDETDRDDVREALRRYMKEHRIGVPTLQARIIESDRPRHREIPLSTLQRFIAGSHHTHDHHVALCHAFVSGLPYYGEDRELAVLGNALPAFLGDRSNGGEREALIARLAAEFAGRYEGKDARLILTPVVKHPFLRAHQEPAISSDQEPSRTGASRRFHEGVMVLAHSGIYMMLRDTLTYQPRIARLLRSVRVGGSSREEILEGEVFQPSYLNAQGILEKDIRFVRSVK